MPNRLANESSPYLLQHQDNPVDWYPWGPEALGRAKAEDKPIFLSIGYSACHWCHVMEHESFENEAIARLLNENFVAIKVDREERPDLDQIYMGAVQTLTGRGGWPMSVFLTPDGRPFSGGTYWPAQRRMGMPGFDEVLQAVAHFWRTRRPDAEDVGEKLSQHLRQLGQSASEGMAGSPALTAAPLDQNLLSGAVASLEQVFDFSFGGFGGAPKFPHPMDLQLLLRFYLRDRREGLLDMVRLTLDRMAAGGIFDHLGGGFHRYSVDRQWLVPHFEKMLYDNALLARTYVEAFRVTGAPPYAETARATLDYLLREMQDPQRGFFSTQDADSEGVEGKFFVWTPDEVRAALGQQLGDEFCRIYDVTDAGNFEQHNILNLGKTMSQYSAILGRDEGQLRSDMAAARARLLEVRSRRVAPGLDDKVLVSWNALALDALAEAAGALDEPRYLAAATRAADFIWQKMRREDGRLWHTWRQGVARGGAFLDDYAALIHALVTLYEADFQEAWIDRAILLAEVLQTHFQDHQHGGFFFTADDHEQLIARQKQMTDEAVPSGNALAATGLLRLGRLTGRSEFIAAAVDTLTAASSMMQAAPQAMGQMLLALESYLGPSYELIVVGDRREDSTRQVLAELRHRPLPPHVIACPATPRLADRSAALDPLLEGKRPAASGPTLYVCENFACREPAIGLPACRSAIDVLAGQAPTVRGAATSKP